MVGNGSGDFVVEGGGATQDVLDSVASGVGRTFGWSGDGPVRRVRRTWLDTFDWRLYRAGLSLEQQAGGSGTELVLTGRDGERLAALPVSNARGGSARGGSARGGSARDGSARDGSARGGNDGAGNGRAPSWPSLITALPPSPLRELVEPIVGIRALMPVARAASRIHGQRALNADAKTVARLAVDEMSVSYPARAKAAPRLSVSPVRGYQAQADRISGTLAGAAGIRPSRQSGLEVALAAVGEQPGRRHRDVQLTPAMPAATAMAAILTAQFDAVEANVPGTIRDIDTEFLHDLRVAVRRTRSALKLAGQPLPADLTAAYRPEFRWLGDLTTPTRDLDVYLLGFGDMVAGLVGAEPADLDPFQEYLLRARAAAHRDLTRGLRSARFARLARQWRGDLDGIRPARRRPTVAQLGARRIAAAQRRALRAGLGITGASPAQDLHDLRKDCKELRYLVEMFGSLHDPAQRWQAIRELKALQDCLGEFQDAEVQRAELRAFADRMLAQRSAPAATLLAMGEIAAGLARRQLQARADFDSRFAAFAGQASQARLAALTEVSAA